MPKNDQYVIPRKATIIQPQKIIKYARSDKFMYPSKTNAAVWKKNRNAISINCPANAINPITNVQKPSTRNMRPTV